MPEGSREKPLKKLQAKDCFVCGSDNPAGLNLPYYYDGARVSAEFVPGPHLCGFDHMVHGGVIFCLADEAMMHLIWASGRKAVTAEVTMRYHNYARVNEKLTITAEFEEIGERLLKARCVLSGDGAMKIATARGKFLPFSGRDNEIFKKRF